MLTHYMLSLLFSRFNREDTEQLFHDESVRKWRAIEGCGAPKLKWFMPHANGRSESAPGNGLHKLTGDREGQHAIRINDQYRVCFTGGWAFVRCGDSGLPLRGNHDQAEADTSGGDFREEFMVPFGLNPNKLAIGFEWLRRIITRLWGEAPGVPARWLCGWGSFFALRRNSG